MKKLVLSAVCAMMAAVTFAEPSVEITKIKLADVRDGTVEYTYTVGGDFGYRKYDLVVRVSSDDGTKSAVVTTENVTAGSATKTVNVKTLLGKAHPGVSLFAELKVKLGGVQLWKDGPFFAECNVGATKPEEYGYYFWWGDTVGYKHDGSKWVSVDGKGTSITFSDTSPANTLNGKNAAALAGYVDANGNLKSDYDAATAHLGAPWRMMTKDELDKLARTDYCRRERVTKYKGVSVSGWVVKGKAGSAYENNEVFFPAVGSGIDSSFSGAGEMGLYWSSTPASDSPYSAWYLRFDSSNFIAYNYVRCYGFSVRAVRNAE